MKREMGLLVVAVLAVGCRAKEEAGPLPRGAFKNAPVILISIDTLRSDRLPFYGYDKVETPALAALAEDGVVFERAYSQIPLTLPSHATILTGQLPGEHGVRDNVGYRFEAGRHPYLPRLLKQAGFATGAAVSSFVLRGETGMADSFDLYEAAIEVRLNESLGRSQRSGHETLRVAGDWLAKAARGGPFFFFLHLYEPHTPYEPPAPFAEKFADPYDGEIAAADAVVGDLVADLKEKGVYDDAIVVVLSDHGEGLGDHGEAEHGILLYREALQVPLVIKLPKGQRGGTRVAEPAALADVFPTLTWLLGVETPKEVTGRALFAPAPSPTEPRRIYSETFYPRLHFGWSELHSLIDDRHHLIQGPDPELYDLEADPGEKTNLRDTERRPFATLRQAVKAFEKPLAAPSAVDAETAGRLAALGYLGSASLSAGDGPLPDPKTRVHTIADFARAVSLVARQDFAGAVPMLEQVLRDNPDMSDGWESLAQSLQKLGRRDEALAAYEKAMSLSGGAGHVAIATGTLLLDMGRLAEAEEHAKLGLATGPAAARSLLARVALERGDAATAEKQAQAALEARGSRVGPLIVLAQIKVKRGNLEEALRLTEQAQQDLDRMEGEQSFPGLALVRGDTLARLGREAEAEQSFRREIEVAPGNPAPYARLAGLFAFQGRGPEAGEMLRRMVEYSHAPTAYAEAVRTLRALGDPRSAAGLLRQGLARHPGSRELRELSSL